MRTIWPNYLVAVVVVVVAGCTVTRHRPHTHEFPAKLAAGCPTEAACRALEAEAEVRVAACAATKFARRRCLELAEAERAIARGYVAAWERRRQDAEAAELAELQRREEHARAEAAREAQARAAREAEEQQEVAGTEWVGVPVTQCAVDGDPSACLEVRRFAARHEGTTYASEAKAALEQGAALLAEKQRVEAERQAQRPVAVRQATPPSSAPGPVAKPSGTSNLLCCDGTRSPTCGCGRASNRGCCSHHGGVCGGCE